MIEGIHDFYPGVQLMMVFAHGLGHYLYIYIYIYIYLPCNVHVVLSLW